MTKTSERIRKKEEKKKSEANSEEKDANGLNSDDLKCTKCNVTITENKDLMRENKELKKENAVLLRELKETKLCLKFLEEERNNCDKNVVVLKNKCINHGIDVSFLDRMEEVDDSTHLVVPVISDNKEGQSINRADPWTRRIAATKSKHSSKPTAKATKPVEANDRHEKVSAVLNKKRKETERPIKKVLVVADSHGRGIQNMLQTYLEDKSVNVTSFIKPGAGLLEIVKGIHDKTANFTQEDVVVLLGGTNDIGGSVPVQYVITQALECFIPLSKKLKIIVNCIPPRLDKPELNRDIIQANKFIHQFINKVTNKNSKNISINFLENKLQSQHYNRSGLHLNHLGKQSLCTSFLRLLKVDSGTKEVSDTLEIRKGPNQAPTMMDRWLKGELPRKKSASTVVNTSNSAKKTVKQTFLEKWLGVKER